MNILHIDSSPRGERSHSRRLTRELIKLWRRLHPESTVRYRDLGAEPPAHVDEGWIAAAFSAPEARTAKMRAALAASDRLVDELLTADLLTTTSSAGRAWRARSSARARRWTGSRSWRAELGVGPGLSTSAAPAKSSSSPGGITPRG